MKLKSILAISMLLTSVWILEAKKSSSSAQAQTSTTSAQPTGQSCTNNSQCSSHHCVNSICQQFSTPNSFNNAKSRAQSFNGILINKASQAFTAQFINDLNMVISSIPINPNQKNMPIPAQTVFINIIPGGSTTPAISASVGMVEKHSGTSGRDLSYVVTNTDGKWNIMMAQQAAQSKAQAKQASSAQ